jgi:hypothetical protein
MMKVSAVDLDVNVYEMMINHALSNEKEEIMGLLIGNVSPNRCFLVSREFQRDRDQIKDRRGPKRFEWQSLQDFNVTGL